MKDMKDTERRRPLPDAEADGVIEAYEHESLPIFGVQWHPERLTNIMRDERTPDMAPIFTYFLEKVKTQ